MKFPARYKHSTMKMSSSLPMSRPVATPGRDAANDFFFSTKPIIQRQGEPITTTEEEQDSLLEGLKTTGERLLQIPEFKAWYEPRFDQIRRCLWEEQPSDTKSSLFSFGVVNVAQPGLVFALNLEIRQMLSGYGFQLTLPADLLRLFPGLRGVF